MLNIRKHQKFPAEFCLNTILKADIAILALVFIFGCTHPILWIAFKFIRIERKFVFMLPGIGMFTQFTYNSTIGYDNS